MTAHNIETSWVELLVMIAMAVFLGVVIGFLIVGQETHMVEASYAQNLQQTTMKLHFFEAQYYYLTGNNTTDDFLYAHDQGIPA